MDLPHIPQDDILDVVEMTRKIENYIGKVLKSHDTKLAMSALISSSINCMFGQCRNLDEILFYRNLYMQILDHSIWQIKVTNPDKSP